MLINVGFTLVVLHPVNIVIISLILHCLYSIFLEGLNQNKTKYLKKLCLQFVSGICVIADPVIERLVHNVPLIDHRCGALVEHLFDAIPRVTRCRPVGLGLGNQLVCVTYPRIRI